MREGAQSWCTGMTLRDVMGRVVEEGSGWGTHVHSWLIHVDVWQRPLRYCNEPQILKKKKEIPTVGKFTGRGTRSEAPGVVGGGSRGGGMDGLGRSRVIT